MDTVTSSPTGAAATRDAAVATSATFINGRFRAQALTGVQRFAVETVAAMERVWPAHLPRPVVLSPRRPPHDPATHGSVDASGFARREIGHGQSHAWEQTILPWAARGGVLVNLGNTGPIAARRQIVVIHDAGVFSRPEGYSLAFRTTYRAIQRILARTGTRLVTVSQFSRREMVRHLGVPEASVAVIPEGADHIHAAAADPSILTRNGLARGGFALVVGSLARHKNLGALDATARLLAERGVELVVTGGFDAHVFGAGPVTPPRPARYVGRVTDPQLRALYEAAGCLIFPSLYEGFGLPAVEAMRCGCPVIAATGSSLPEICGDAALFCDPTSPDDFARAADRLLSDPRLRDTLRARGLARASGFTWDRTARALIDIIASRGERA